MKSTNEILIHEDLLFKRLGEMISLQEQKMVELAQQHYRGIVLDDLWQPNDFPRLESCPLFRYEEGVREGLLSAQSALYALRQEAAI